MTLFYMGWLQGTVVYGHYGTEENFLLLQNEMRINMSGKVVLLRASENTFAEKVGLCTDVWREDGKDVQVISTVCLSFFFFFCLQVANAAKFGASAVLIYADPSDYSFEENTQLFGHVSECLFFFSP